MRPHPYKRKKLKDNSVVCEAKALVPGQNGRRNVPRANSISIYSEYTNDMHECTEAGCQGEEDIRFLWSAISIKNYSVTDWQQFVSKLNKSFTLALSTYDTIVPRNVNDHEEYWKNFTKAVSKATSLVNLRIERCPTTVIENLMNLCPNLEELQISNIKNESSQINTTGVASNLTLMNLYKLSKLVTLHLNGQNGLSLMPMQPLTNLKCLTHLSLQSIKSFPDNFSEALKTMPNTVLCTLEIGDCDNLPNSFPDALAHFDSLETLKLINWRNGRQKFAVEIFTIIRQLKKLKFLELDCVNLINCKMGELKKCTKITSMLIAPALTNSMSMNDDMVTLVSILRDMPKALEHMKLGLKLRMLENLNETMKSERPRRNQVDLRIKTYTDLKEKLMAEPDRLNPRNQDVFPPALYRCSPEIELDTIFYLENWLQSKMRGVTRVEIIMLQSTHDSGIITPHKIFLP